MKITQKQLNAAVTWYDDFACVNDSYNLDKYKMTQKTMLEIIRRAKNLLGFEWRSITLKQFNK